MLSFSKLTGPDVCSENHGHLSYPPNGDFGDFHLNAFITNDNFSI